MGLNRIKLEDIVHDDEMPAAIGSLRGTDQLAKRKAFRKGMKGWNDRYKESSKDEHPHRMIIKCDSHQLDKKYPSKLTGRHPTLTPCKAIVNANDLVDRVCLLKLVGAKHIPDDIEMDPLGFRWGLTYDGRTINKNPQRFIAGTLCEERQLKLSMRDDHGLIGRVEGKMDVAQIAMDHSTLR